MGKKPSKPSIEAADDGHVYLSDVSPRDKAWDEHKANSDIVAEIYQGAGYKRYSERVKSCSLLLKFAFRTNDLEEKVFKLLTSDNCHVRHCPVCQWRRSLMWRARFFQAIPKILEDYSKYRFIFLTLTVKNCQLENLRETITLMNKSWQRLVKRKQFPGIGFIKSLEVTRSLNNSAHPHFHIILLVSSSYFAGKYYLSTEKWANLWQSCLRIDYVPIVNVKTVKSKKNVDDAREGLMIALCETLKYSVKEGDLLFSEEWLVGLTQQLHKMRSVSVGGVFKDYISDEEPEDLVDFDVEDSNVSDSDLEFWFSWKEMLKRYQSL